MYKVNLILDISAKKYVFFINVISNNVNNVDNEILKYNKKTFEIVYNVNKKDPILKSYYYSSIELFKS